MKKIIVGLYPNDVLIGIYEDRRIFKTTCECLTIAEMKRWVRRLWGAGFTFELSEYAKYKGVQS